MATEFGTKLTYSAKANSTEDISQKEFWGKGHIQAAQEYLAKVSDGKPAFHYHVMEAMIKES